MRTALETDGRVRIMSGHLSATCPHVLGQLFRFWCLGDKHATEDGVLYGWTAEGIDEYLNQPGFCRSMPADWIDLSGPWVKLPDYQEHNGTTAKRRASEAKRKANERRNASASDADICPQKVLTESDEMRGNASSLISSSLDPGNSKDPDPTEELDPKLRKYFDVEKRDLATGRCPIKGYPHVWLRLDELEDARGQFDKARLDLDDWRAAVKRANSQLEGKQHDIRYKGGMAHSYLTGHILHDAIDTKTKANRLNGGPKLKPVPEASPRQAANTLASLGLQAKTMERKA